MLHYPNTKNTVHTNLWYMTGAIRVEIVGLKSSECSPFPCDETGPAGYQSAIPQETWYRRLMH